MAESLGEWISQAVIKHDEDHGANLEVPWTGKRYGQLIKFETYRTSGNPHAEVCGTLSDRANWVRVRFDPLETDKFEEAIPGIPTETLTSHLRAVFLIKQFTFRILPPKTACKAALPILELYVTEWNIAVGDRYDPVFNSSAVEVGEGRTERDRIVRQVLRKWYYGESNSDLSRPNLKVEEAPPVAGPSRHPERITSRSTSTLSKASASDPSPQLTARMTFLDYIQPWLNPGTDKRSKKAIPDILFEVPADQRAELDEIKVFGVDTVRLLQDGASSNVPSVDQRSGEEVIRDDMPTAYLPAEDEQTGAAQEEAIRERESFRVDTRGLPPSHENASSMAVESVNFRLPYAKSQKQAMEVDTESEDEILIKRPAMTSKPKRKRMLDLLHSSPSASLGGFSLFSEDQTEIAMRAGLSRSRAVVEEGDVGKEEDTDEDELSDYEREARRRGKMEASTSSLSDSLARRPVNSQQTSSLTSLPASYRSVRSPFSSSPPGATTTPRDDQKSDRLMTFSTAAPASAFSPPTQVLVDDSESAERGAMTESLSFEAQRPTKRPKSSSQASTRSKTDRKRSRSSVDNALEYEAENREEHNEESQVVMEPTEPSLTARFDSAGSSEVDLSLEIEEGDGPCDQGLPSSSPHSAQPRRSRASPDSSFAKPRSFRTTPESVAASPSSVNLESSNVNDDNTKDDNDNNDDTTGNHTRESSIIPQAASRYLNPLRLFSGSKTSPPLQEHLGESSSKEDTVLGVTPKKRSPTFAKAETSGRRGRRSSLMGFLWGRSQSPSKAEVPSHVASEVTEGQVDTPHEEPGTTYDEEIGESTIDPRKHPIHRPSLGVDRSRGTMSSPRNREGAIRATSKSTQSPTTFTPPSSGRLAARSKPAPKLLQQRSASSIDTPARHSAEPLHRTDPSELPQAATTTTHTIIEIETVADPIPDAIGEFEAILPSFGHQGHTGRNKLGGFKPDLTVDDGLSQIWVEDSIRLAKIQRARMASR